MSAVRAEGVRRVASSPHAVARARIGTSNGRAVRYHWLGWDGGLVNNYVVTSFTRRRTLRWNFMLTCAKCADVVTIHHTRPQCIDKGWHKLAEKPPPASLARRRGG